MLSAFARYKNSAFENSTADSTAIVDDPEIERYHSAMSMCFDHTYDTALLIGIAITSLLATLSTGVVWLFKRQLLRKTEGLKTQNKALRMAEERYQRLFEMETDAHILTDNESGRVLEVNPAAIALYGYSREEWLAMSHTDVSAEPDKTRHATVNGIARVPLRWHRKKDGTVFPVEITAYHFEWQGKPVHEAAIRDISERRKTEAELRMLMTAIAQIPESVMMTDAQGHILYVNPAFERITGYSRAEAIGKNPRILKSGRQDAQFYLDLWATLTTGQVWRGHFINKKKDGTCYTEDAVIAPVRNDSGEVVNYIAIKRDITHEVEVENQLRQAQKMDSIGRLAGGVAHDFNNILMAIIGNAELALEALPADNSVRTDIEEILHSSERAAALTRQLLTFARHQQVHPQVLKISELILNLSRMMQRLIGENISLKTEIATDLWSVKADPSQIEQVLVNMVINSRDAMPGGGTLTIRTLNMTFDVSSATRYQEMPPGEYVKILVQDTGTGIPEDVKEHIFEPFFTTKAKGKGTGIGLATCFGIIKKNGGYIGFDSAVGKGTTFRICFPRCREALSNHQTEPLRKEWRGTETILLAEDDKALRQVVSRALAANGYTVLEAVNGRDALDVAANYAGNIQLLLSDVIMPEMNGPTLLDHLIQTRPAIKVIFHSGYIDDALVGDSMAKHGALFIEKPFSVAALLSKISEALKSK